MTLPADDRDRLPPAKPIPRHKGHWLWGGTFDFQRNPAEFALEAMKAIIEALIDHAQTPIPAPRW